MKIITTKLVYFFWNLV